MSPASSLCRALSRADRARARRPDRPPGGLIYARRRGLQGRHRDAAPGPETAAADAGASRRAITRALIARRGRCVVRPLTPAMIAASRAPVTPA